MNKKIKKRDTWTIMICTAVLFVAMLFTACESDDVGGGEIKVTKIYLQDVNSSVPDRAVTFARLGQLLRIEGNGFIGLKRVYINGFLTYFNPVYISQNSMLISISGDTPTMEADPNVRNTIRFVNDNFELTVPFEIRDGAPAITNISNTLPVAGETITVYGTGLVEVSKVVFPDGIEVTEGITSDVDGEFFTVSVPNGVSPEGGSLFIESSNGGAYSPAYFNFENGVILNFDGQGVHGFWDSGESMITDADLESAPIGNENTSQGTYVPHRPARIDAFAPASNRNSEVWTAGDVDDWRGQLTPYIPATTPLDQVAFQFDIYVPEPWQDSGYLKICLVNAFNGGEWSGASYNYVPWIVDGEVQAFQTTGWTTVTIPLDKLYSFSDGDYTFEDVLASREAANYKNFGIYFENSDIKLSDVTGTSSEVEFVSAETSVNVYTDNWRIVSLETPAYSDFPE